MINNVKQEVTKILGKDNSGHGMNHINGYLKSWVENLYLRSCNYVKCWVEKPMVRMQYPWILDSEILG